MTVLELITASLRLLGVVAEGENPSNEGAEDAISALNLLLDSYGSGLSLTAANLHSQMRVSRNNLRALKYELAIELAPEYNIEPPELVKRRAWLARRVIKRDNFANYGEHTLSLPDELKKTYPSIYEG